MNQNFKKILFYPIKKANNLVAAFAIVIGSPLEDEMTHQEKVNLFDTIVKRRVLSSF